LQSVDQQVEVAVGELGVEFPGYPSGQRARQPDEHQANVGESHVAVESTCLVGRIDDLLKQSRASFASRGQFLVFEVDLLEQNRDHDSDAQVQDSVHVHRERPERIRSLRDRSLGRVPGPHESVEDNSGHERAPVVEMPVEGADADSGPFRDLVQRRVGTALDEDVTGCHEDLPVVAAGVSPQGTHRIRRWSGCHRVSLANIRRFFLRLRLRSVKSGCEDKRRKFVRLDLWTLSKAWLGRTARAADQSGLDTLWVSDHLLQADPNISPGAEMLEAYTTLGFLASHTERIRLGTMVTAVTYRPPALLVKAVTTLDVLSGGRAWLGIGAGYHQGEAAAMGLSLPALGQRFERLEETLRIALAMWAGDDTAFEGIQYRLARPVNRPNSIRRPHPPILIGGMGESKTLPLVARYADACNLFDIPDGGQDRDAQARRPRGALRAGGTVLRRHREDPEHAAATEGVPRSVGPPVF
jgi:F420-dependent oxidoreductase-like protein